jgi:hypothetical protein
MVHDVYTEGETTYPLPHRTSVEYTPLLDIGLGKRTFENFNVAAPRFVPQLCFMEDANADPTTAQC